MRVADWTGVTNVLAVRLDGMGDVLMTTPALRALRESSPGRRITLLTSPAGAEAARHAPEVDEVIVYEAPWMKPEPPGGMDAAADLRLIEDLRSRRFDAAAIFTVYTQSPLPAALLLYMAGIDRVLAHCREKPYHLISDHVPEREPEIEVRHEVQRQLDLVAAVGCATTDTRLSFVPSEAETISAREKLRRGGIDPARPFVAVHPGGTAPSRRYPADAYAEVTRRFRAETDVPVMITGSVHEQDLAGRIAEMSGCETVSLAGQLSVGELGAVLALADVLLSGNTGPVHIAAAMGTPVVDLYALTNPQHTPWGVPSRVLYEDVECRYCYRSVCPHGGHDCLVRVPPAAVADAMQELLASPRAPAADDLRSPVLPVLEAGGTR